LPTRREDHNPFVAVRVGEPGNPGPEGLQMNLAIINPTSITSKTGEFRELQPESWLRIRKLEAQGPSNSYF